ncbi:MAG: DinB family protein [Gemmatimonadaceae bacterium]
MPITDLLLPEYDLEMGITRTVLERVPDDKGEWKPHPKSFSMAHLAQLVARMPSWVRAVTDRPELDLSSAESAMSAGYSTEKTATLLALFDKNVIDGRAAIAAMTDERFGEQWSFKAGGHTMFTQAKYLALRTSVLNHLVHHRAQLGVYLRLVDEPVPGMYGPTADTKQG